MGTTSDAQTTRSTHDAQATQQAGVALSDDLRDRLVAISEAVADQDDRAAQAMLREILKAPQPSPTAQAADSVLEDAARWQWLADYLIGERTDLDEGIVACATIDALRQFADAARKQGGA